MSDPGAQLVVAFTQVLEASDEPDLEAVGIVAFQDAGQPARRAKVKKIRAEGGDQDGDAGGGKDVDQGT